jgi:PHD/YefM family antitoxin component YafN of YafNO toxin-antitoxin module
MDLKKHLLTVINENKDLTIINENNDNLLLIIADLKSQLQQELLDNMDLKKHLLTVINENKDLTIINENNDNLVLIIADLKSQLQQELLDNMDLKKQLYQEKNDKRDLKKQLTGTIIELKYSINYELKPKLIQEKITNNGLKTQLIYTIITKDNLQLLTIKLKEELNQEKTINKLLQENIGNSENNKCSICFTSIISKCCIPCGHTYCNNCITSTDNCHICRSYVDRLINIYI